jgi:deaminated glutathione amidase
VKARRTLAVGARGPPPRSIVPILSRRRCISPESVETYRMSWRLPTAAIQMTATADLSANLAVVRRLVGESAAGGARLVVLPECFPFLGTSEGEKMSIAEDLDGKVPGPIQAALAELAAKHGVWIVGGGMPERIAGDPRRAYNTAVVLDPSGALHARYRKIHLFDVNIPGGAVLRESDAMVAGDSVVVVEVDGAKIGLTICYDLRFPELYRELVIDRGAEVLLVPAAFTAHTGRFHWHLLLRARAIENQAWVVAAAQTGHHNDKRESFGHSMIIDPWGAIVAEREQELGVIVTVLDSESVHTRRRQMPCFEHATRWPGDRKERSAP